MSEGNTLAGALPADAAFHDIKDLEFSQDDFLSTTLPYEMIYRYRDDPFQHDRQLSIMCSKAAKVGIRNFKTLYSKYTLSLKKTSTDIYICNTTQFEGQAIELDAGNWQCDERGVMRWNGQKEEVACCHPILPVERLVNIDTGVEKLKIAYSKGRKWREIIVDKRTLASANSIVSLADMGIAVNSENAKSLVQYISDIENLNYDRLPERKSVGRLGYIEGEGFSPYVDGLIFDGDANYRTMFQAIAPHGDYTEWLETARECRKMSTTARIMLAAAFASVLIQRLGGLPFFVHLWGVDSGTGKTVALMLAASVWGDPQIGRYVQTFNSTAVGQEKTAAFLNSIPVLVDELQLAKDGRGRTQFNVYALAQGVGRTRGNKSGRRGAYPHMVELHPDNGGIPADQHQRWGRCDEPCDRYRMPRVGKGYHRRHAHRQHAEKALRLCRADVRRGAGKAEHGNSGRAVSGDFSGAVGQRYHRKAGDGRRNDSGGGCAGHTMDFYGRPNADHAGNIGVFTVQGSGFLR